MKCDDQEQASESKRLLQDPAENDQNLSRQAARIIARKLWLLEFKQENPDASKEDIRTAWKAARSEQVKIVMKAVRAVERSGLKLIKTRES